MHVNFKTSTDTLSLENSPSGMELIRTNSLAEFQGDMLPTFTGRTMWAFLRNSVGTDLSAILTM